MISKRILHKQLQRFYSSSLQEPKSVAVIKLPAYIKKHVKKSIKSEEHHRLEVYKKIAYRGDTSKPVISSTNAEFNFYLGQVYRDSYPIPLQSKFWFKRKSSGQKFMIKPWDQNPSLPITFQDDEKMLESYFPSKFSELRLNEPILESLKTSGYEIPTPLQTLAIPKILTHHHVVCAAETGCGKTLAYLTPIMQQILSYKKSMKLFPDTPLVLVIAPGQELAQQIAQTAYSLGSKCGVDVKLLVPDGTKHRHLIPYRDSSIDLLVASLGILNKLFTKGVFKLANVQHLILDEADTLLDDSFHKDITYLLSKLPIQTEVPKNNEKPFGTQLIIVSSTYPYGVNNILPEPLTEADIIKVRSPYLHRLQPHVTQRFWRVNADTKAGELLDLVKKNYTSKAPVMIFNNKSPSCDWMSLFLHENGVQNVKFHAGMDSEERRGIFQAFQRGDVDVICCTDLASRGLDTQRVKHVINFDFPNNMSDYILRAGRVGRVGSNQGSVTSFIESRSGVYTLQSIEMAVRKSIQLPDVDANIKRKIKKLHFTF